MFVEQYIVNKAPPLVSYDLFNVRQYQGESLKDFLNRFGAQIVRLPGNDGGGPSTPHHGCQNPRLDRHERLDSRRERLGHDEGRLHMERLGGDLDRLGPITRSMAKNIHAQMDAATDGREKALYMLHGGQLGVA